MNTPDVTGFLIENARITLENWKQNIEIREIESRSPKDKNEFPVEEIRVIKQENFDTIVFLTIANF